MEAGVKWKLDTGFIYYSSAEGFLNYFYEYVFKYSSESLDASVRVIRKLGTMFFLS